MYSEQDERRGLVKTTWNKIRARVSEVEPEFSKLVDKISPDDSFSLYLAYYPYGDMDADIQSTLFPDLEGGYFRLNDSSVSKQLLSDLGYSINNTPLGMVLEKQIECFVNLPGRELTIPSCMYNPGRFFPLTKILNCDSARIHAPYRLLYSTAGARSVFMLPNIGCNAHHKALQRDFKIANPAPKSLYHHWDIFKQIVKNDPANSDWRCCVVYFTKKWLDKIYSDKSWSEVRQYLQNKAWRLCDYDINRVNYDMIFSIIQQNRNLKPNPYLADTAKHLLSIALGESPGYVPAIDEEALPARVIQKAFVESYGLKKYMPVILHPSHYKFEEENRPIYYSLQNPTTFVFSPKSIALNSTLDEMRELQHITNIFVNELARDGGMCSGDSIINKLAKRVRFNYYHNKYDNHEIIQHSSMIPDLDERFRDAGNSDVDTGSRFACDGPFVRGCVSIGV